MPVDAPPSSSTRRSEGLVRPALGALVVSVAVSITAGAMVWAWVRDVHRGWRVYHELHRQPLVNGVVVDPDGTRDRPHPYEPLGTCFSDGFCRRCGRDSRHELHRDDKI